MVSNVVTKKVQRTRRSESIEPPTTKHMREFPSVAEYVDYVIDMVCDRDWKDHTGCKKVCACKECPASKDGYVDCGK